MPYITTKELAAEYNATPQGQWIPSPEEIEQMASELRASWPENRFPTRQPVEVPRLYADRHRKGMMHCE